MRQETKTAFLVIALLWLLSSACNKTTVLRASVELAPGYRQALLACTATGTLYDRLERRVEVYAVLFTSPLRQQFAARYRELFGLDIRPGGGDLEDAFVASEGKIAALVVLECEDLRLCDVSRPDAIWKLLLQAGGESLQGKIRKLRTPRPTLEGLFPFTGSFFTAFWIIWPPASEQLKPAGLLVTSPYGRLELRWPGEGAVR